MKNKILQEFLNSDIKIISQEKLEQYIEYCIYKNQNGTIKDETSHHHILPKALFNEYKDLKENSWNGTHLLYSDHYYAHWLLIEAIDDYGQLIAFCSMHNQDLKVGRINESDLIPAEEFQLKNKEAATKKSSYMKEMIVVGDEVMSRASFQAKKNAAKRSKYYIDENGKKTNSYLEGAKKANITKKTPYVDKNGNITTPQEERIKAYKKSLNIKDEEGITLRERMGKKQTALRMNKGRFYNIYQIDKGLIHANMWLRDVKKISTALSRTSKEKFLGYSASSKASLKRYDIEHLYGYYVEEVSNSG